MGCCPSKLRSSPGGGRTVDTEDTEEYAGVYSSHAYAEGVKSKKTKSKRFEVEREDTEEYPGVYSSHVDTEDTEEHSGVYYSLALSGKSKKYTNKRREADSAFMLASLDRSPAYAEVDKSKPKRPKGLKDVLARRGRHSSRPLPTIADRVPWDIVESSYISSDQENERHSSLSTLSTIDVLALSEGNSSPPLPTTAVPALSDIAFSSKSAELKNEDGIYYIGEQDITISNPNTVDYGITNITISSQPVTEKEFGTLDGTHILSQMITLEPHGMVFEKHFLVKFPILQDRYRSDQNVCLMYSDGSCRGDNGMHWVNISQHSNPSIHKDEMFWFIKHGFCYLFLRHFSHIFLLEVPQTSNAVPAQYGIFLLVSVYGKYVKKKLIITVGFHCHRCFADLLEPKGSFGTLLGYKLHCVYGLQGPVTIHIAVDNNNDWKCFNPEQNISVDQLLPLCNIDAIYNNTVEFRNESEVNVDREVKVEVKVLQDKTESNIFVTTCLKDISNQVEASTIHVGLKTDAQKKTHAKTEASATSVGVIRDFQDINRKLNQTPLSSEVVVKMKPEVKRSETQIITESIQNAFCPTESQFVGPSNRYNLAVHSSGINSDLDNTNAFTSYVQPVIGQKIEPTTTDVYTAVQHCDSSPLLHFKGVLHNVLGNYNAKQCDTSPLQSASDMCNSACHSGVFNNDVGKSNAIISNVQPVTGKHAVSTTTTKHLDGSLLCSDESGEPSLNLCQTKENHETNQHNETQMLKRNDTAIVHTPNSFSPISNMQPHMLQQFQGYNIGAAGLNPFYAFHQNIGAAGMNRFYPFYQNNIQYINYNQSSNALEAQLPEADCVFNRSVVSEQEKLCDIIDNDCKDQLAEIAKAVGDTNGTVDIKNITALSLLQVWKIHVKEEKCTWREFYDMLVRLKCQSAALQLKVVCEKDRLVRGLNKLKRDISLDMELCGFLLELDVISLAENDEINLIKSPPEKINFLVLELLVKKPGKYVRVKGFFQALHSMRYYGDYVREFLLCPEDIYECDVNIKM